MSTEQPENASKSKKRRDTIHVETDAKTRDALRRAQEFGCSISPFTRKAICEKADKLPKES